MRNSLYYLCAILLLTGCQNNKSDTEVKVSSRVVNVPTFLEDSAFWFVEKQVSFGPRVPNTSAHKKTGDFLINRLEKYGAKVKVQEFESITYDNQQLSLRNIIGSFNPEKQKRVLLAAHWDTRPFADKDSNDSDRPIDGANDGGSGVGVLMEIARVISKQPPDIGVDIIFFDGEDWGTASGEASPSLPGNLDSWWCLGSQYWSTNKHEPNYFAYYGILLDMVGAKNSQFHIEGLSNQVAPKVVSKVWSSARKIGFGNVFINRVQAGITDDHEFVNKLAKIPMINIVHYDPEFGYFGDYHHSHKDNLDLIDKNILKAVGQTVLEVIYYE